MQPLRLAVYDPRLRVRRLRGIGHRASCLCGYSGPRRLTVAAARIDLAGHMLEHDA